MRNEVEEYCILDLEDSYSRVVLIIFAIYLMKNHYGLMDEVI